MICFEYDPGFVEQATFLYARQDAARECALHQAVDGLYRIQDAEIRQRRFRDAYAELFRQMELDKVIPDVVVEFERTCRDVPRCLVGEAERTSTQSVDLYNQKATAGGDSGAKALIVALRPEFFLSRERFRPWFLRQLQHVEDMLDVHFRYDPALPSGTKVQQNLIRDRYGLLWNAFVEGRLIRRGQLDGNGLEPIWELFCKAFPGEGSGRRAQAFDRLLRSDDLTHAQLMSWAKDPRKLFAFGGGGKDEKNECRPQYEAAST